MRQAQIYRVRSSRWVYGDAQTLAELDATSFDYKSQAGAKLALAAARQLNEYHPSAGVEVLILALIDRGVPLTTKIGSVSLGAALVQAAAAQGREDLFAKLSERSVLKLMSRPELTSAFMGVGCSAKIARSLVEHGAEPHVVGDNGTALTRLRGSGSSCEGNSDKMLETARTLIALGVPLEAPDNLGWAALMGSDSPKLAQLLLAHSANPNARAKNDTTPAGNR